MGNLGIGLGAFAEGFGNGINLRRQADDAKFRRQQMEKQTADQQANADFDASAKSEFDKGVSEGKYDPEGLQNFMIQYKGPQKAAMLMQQGDYAGAKAWKDWYESDAAKEGTHLFGKALFQAQQGDLSGAIDSAVKSAQVKGYLDHTYSLGAKEPIKDDKGNIGGYRVHLKNSEGDDLTWDVTPQNIESGIVSLFNPEAAYSSRVAAKLAKDKAAIELDTFSKQQGIKAEYDAQSDARKHAFDIDTIKQKKAMGVDSGAKPSDVSAAEWLAGKTAAAAGRTVTDQDMLDAYGQIRQAKDNPNSRAALVVRVAEGYNKDLRDRRSPDEKMAAAKDFVQSLLDVESAPSKEKGSAARAKGGESKMAIPTELAKEPAGTIFHDDKGTYYEIRDGFAFTIPKPSKGK